jgi:hypothetical protein
MKTPISLKIRILATTALATAAVAIPVGSTVSIAAHDARKAHFSPASHRLAIDIKPNSVRLT